MAGKQPQVVLNPHQQSPDYVDTLEPGYRFDPTDLELIMYYLKRKIESGEHPRCRMYDVNVYDHHPEELKERYRSCEGIWYYFTKREPKYPMGKKVNRKTKFGTWRSTQRENPVYDFVTRRNVGTKRSLAFHYEDKKKTPWLMQEFTYNGTNTNKFTDWVLCKIYKKDSTHDDSNINDNKTDLQVQNTRNHDKPSSAKRQKALPDLERNQVNDQANNQLGENAVITMQPPYAFQVFAPQHVQSFYPYGYYKNQSVMSTSTNGIRFLSGVSSSSSESPHADRSIGGHAHNTYHEDIHTQVNMQDAAHDIYEEYFKSLFDNNYDDDEGVHPHFTSVDEFMKSTHSTCHQDSQTLVNIQGGCNQSMDATTDDHDDDIHEQIMSLLGDDEDV